jgi:hypothetical protein
MRILVPEEQRAAAGGSVIESLPEDGLNMPSGGPGFYGSFGFTASECALLGAMAGVSAGLVTLGVCTMASTSAGWTTMPACMTAASTLAPVVGATTVHLCNDASGR